MDIPRRLVGIAVPDERPLAGRLVAWMFIVGAVVTTLLPLLPGVEGEFLAPTIPIGIAAFVWGVVALRVVRLARHARLGHPRSTVAGAVSPPRSRRTTPAARTPPRAC